MLASLVFLLTTGAALAAFPQDPPNDPEYAPAEGSPSDCLTKSADDQERYLFSFMPQCSPGATDPEECASGMSIDRAWREFTTGRPEQRDRLRRGRDQLACRATPRSSRNRVFLNPGELPASDGSPRQPKGNHQRRATTRRPTLTDANANGLRDPEDLIVSFTNGVDNDGNGYQDDISGWDFYTNQNDPATIDTTYTHANSQMKQAAAQANNGVRGAGICPKCLLLPVKAGAEALDRTDDLAQAWLFAADAGVGHRLGHRRPRLLDLHAPGGREHLAARRGDGRGLERLQLHRPPGRHVVAARVARQRGRGQRPGCAASRRAGEHDDVPGAVELHVLGHPQHVLGRH